MSDDHTPAPSRGRSSSRTPRGKTSDLYASITQRVIDTLERGVVPWRSPILSQEIGVPRNLVSGKPYRGVNTFLLAITAHFMGYDSAHWVTYRQAQAAGGFVKKGEKSTPIVFYKLREVKDKESEKPKHIPLLRFFSVFNVTQCEGLRSPEGIVEPKQFTPIQAAAEIVAGYRDAPAIEHTGSRAFYAPVDDRVRIPEPGRFGSAEEYYGTLFHELGHSTGHSKRLDRGLDTKLAPFGSPDYSKEELVAEMTAAFLCSQCGIEPAVLENQAAYLKGWLGKLKQDSKLIVTAAAAAQRAADHITGGVTDELRLSSHPDDPPTP